MLKTLLATLVIGLTPNGAATAGELYKPYAESDVNYLYNLLFCDDISLWSQAHAKGDKVSWATLLAQHPDKAALREIAADQNNEGRIRALAYNRLRASGEDVPSRIILGVIVEVSLEEGLDVLAAFSEGGVRYLNHSGNVAIFEGQGNPAETLAKELISVSQPLVNQIGPWDEQRLPPPKAGNARVTFLVSDGLYFGEGLLGALQADPMSGPVLAKAVQLLQRVVAVELERNEPAKR